MLANRIIMYEVLCNLFEFILILFVITHGCNFYTKSNYVVLHGFALKELS